MLYLCPLYLHQIIRLEFLCVWIRKFASQSVESSMHFGYFAFLLCMLVQKQKGRGKGPNILNCLSKQNRNLETILGRWLRTHSLLCVSAFNIIYWKNNYKHFCWKLLSIAKSWHQNLQFFPLTIDANLKHSDALLF